MPSKKSSRISAAIGISLALLWFGFLVNFAWNSFYSVVAGVAHANHDWSYRTYAIFAAVVIIGAVIICVSTHIENRGDRNPDTPADSERKDNDEY